MRSIPVLVAGGGASGMVAAIEAAKLGANVTVIEKKNKPGKKILATGNGRCNFTNRNQEISCYHSSDDMLVQMVLQRFDYQKVIDYFWESGVMSKERDGYYYPLSGQAASVRAMLEREMDRYKVEVHCDETLQRIIPRKDLSGQNITGYEVQTDRDKYLVRKLILAVGGSAAPAQGTTGDGYRMLQELGVAIVPPLPALTSIELDDACCKLWSGVRIMGQVELWCEGSRLAEDIGEIQMVAKGISGIPVFQISRYAARALNQGIECSVTLDLCPLRKRDQVLTRLKDRRAYTQERRGAAVLLGMFPDKLCSLLLERAGISLKKQGGDWTDEDCERLAAQIKGLHFTISRCRGYEQAQICTGGVPLTELDHTTMESRRVPGLYLTGELIDVDSVTGGYNLQVAWSTGYLAGISVY